jgi:hypothetical protein
MQQRCYVLQKQAVLKQWNTKFRKILQTYLQMQVATLFRETATLLGASMEAQDPSGSESQALKLWVGSVNSTYEVIINPLVFMKKILCFRLSALYRM